MSTEANDTFATLIAEADPSMNKSTSLNYWNESVKRDWTPERNLAKQRAKVYIDKRWEGIDNKTGNKIVIYQPRFSKFCWTDYKKRAKFTIKDSPQILGFKCKVKNTNNEENKHESFHFIISFKNKRIRLYRLHPRNEGNIVRFATPFHLDFAPVIRNNEVYDNNLKSYHKRIIKLIRSKAHKNGIKMPKGDFSHPSELLIEHLYPALKYVREQYLLKSTFTPGYEDEQALGDTFVMRIVHHQRKQSLKYYNSDKENLVKSITGWNGKVLKRLFWESINNKQASKWIDACCWTSMLRKWLPIDYTQKIFQSDKIITFSRETNGRASKAILKYFGPKKALDIITGTIINNNNLIWSEDYYFRDSVRAYRQLLQDNPTFKITGKHKNIKELHDWLELERRKIVEKESLLNQEKEGEWANNIKDKIITLNSGESYKIAIPNSNWEMAEWGRQMSNCIGGYAYHVKNKYCQIIGLIGNNGECAYGIEIRNKIIAQFRGKFNKAPESELEFAIKEFLLNNRIIVQEFEHILDMHSQNLQRPNENGLDIQPAPAQAVPAF